MNIAQALDADPTAQRSRFDSDRGLMIGGQCSECKTLVWPRRAVCPACGSGAVIEHALPASGSLETWTTVRVPINGIEPPYVLGMVRLGGVRVFGHVRGEVESIRVPAPVKVVVHPDDTPPFHFEVEPR